MLLPYINPRLPLSKSHAVIAIGRLVEAVARTNGPAYGVTLDALGDEQVKSTSLSTLFDCVPQLNVAYADCCDDEHQEMFWMAYREIGLEDSPLGLVCMNSTETGYLSTAQSMNALADRIRLLISCQEMGEVAEQGEMIVSPAQCRAMHQLPKSLTCALRRGASNATEEIVLSPSPCKALPPRPAGFGRNSTDAGASNPDRADLAQPVGQPRQGVHITAANEQAKIMQEVDQHMHRLHDMIRENWQYESPWCHRGLRAS